MGGVYLYNLSLSLHPSLLNRSCPATSFKMVHFVVFYHFLLWAFLLWHFVVLVFFSNFKNYTI
ncbi:unnamed protein product [Meloidogyne enterolobii]|uniref:Uncharacterized protein n=1 Tax=Meloidogyne enterolobii TaxID=390850 RepID=A0ACB1ASC1_MELEN